MVIGGSVNLETSPWALMSSPMVEKDVNFIDYDGRLLYSLTAQEFVALRELPPAPTHEGLIAQGWNWSLSGAKNYVADCGKLTMGLVYVPEDGRTKLHIHLTEGRTSPYLGLAVNGKVQVDWGDGTAVKTITGSSISDSGVGDVISTQHSYSAPGDYVIAIKTVSGQFAFKGTSDYVTMLWKNETTKTGENYCYRDCIYEINVGDGCVFGPMACYNMRGLTTITFPNGFSLEGSDSAFYYAYGLRYVVFPDYCGIADNCFYLCYSLKQAPLPEHGSVGKQAFCLCRSMKSINLPSDLTELSEKAIYSCTTVSYITLPSTLRSIGTASLASLSVSSLKLPNGLEEIGTQAFANSMGLTTLTIPESVTSIAFKGFYSCSGLQSLIFLSATPPAVLAADAWTGLASVCTIIVPAGCRDAYVSAENYPSSSTYNYVEMES